MLSLVLKFNLLELRKSDFIQARSQRFSMIRTLNEQKVIVKAIQPEPLRDQPSLLLPKETCLKYSSTSLGKRDHTNRYRLARLGIPERLSTPRRGYDIVLLNRPHATRDYCTKNAGKCCRLTLYMEDPMNDTPGL